ncbi:MAG: hypothetical protein N3A01_02670, partial [Bacteroidales bacterium]|nr:hypothetical protein [Bacteroidales bacterium]
MKKIENINSKVSFKIGIDKNELIPHQYCLYLKANELPLYLVEPDMMDLLYPPTKKIILDERKVYNQFKEIKSSSNRYNINEIKDLNKLTREAKITETMICVGLYMPSKPEFSTHKTSFTYDRASINQIEQYNDYSNLLDKLEYPAIFICPERVVEWADKLGINSQVLFKKVYFHELGHSYIHNSNRNSYNNIYYKIIEESFCNAIALNEFLNPDELKQAVSAIYSQPL